MAREFESFVDGFVEYTSGLPSSVLWRKWAAIATISGALERKVWTYTLQSNLYPNQFVFLIGPPAVGKTVLSSIVQDLWYAVGDMHIAPSSASSAAFVDALRAAEKRVVRPAEFTLPVAYNALAASVNELGVLIKKNDSEFMAVLTDLYDCKRYGERKRTSKLEYTLEAPCVNMLGCATPSYLSDVLPEGAWQQGLMSRVIIIYSGLATRPPLFGGRENDKMQYEKLKKDLKEISKLYGQFKFTEEAAGLITNWYDAGGPPVPEHPKLEFYNNRRTAKLLKLCMVAAVDRGDALVITAESFRTALGWLLEAEALMPEVFKAMSSGGQEQIIKDLWFFAFDKFTRTKRAVPEPMIYEFLQRRLPAIQVEPMCKQLLAAKIFTVVINDDGTRGWRPRAKVHHEETK